MKLNRLREVETADRYDAVFLNRDLAGSAMGVLERRLLRRNSRVVFDFDDAIFVGKSEAVTRLLCLRSAWVTPGNEYLAEYAARFSPNVTVVPTAIDTERFRPVAVPARSSTAVRVGWSGSDQSIASTLFPFLDVLADAQREYPFELVIVSNTLPSLPRDDLQWSFVPWSPESEGDLGMEFDIGIMPLVDDPFQRGKCGMKLLQYMACGLPTIASPVGVNRQITVEGDTGFLASDRRRWVECLGSLVSSADLRRRLGAAGRTRCVASYSLDRWAPELIMILERICGSPLRKVYA
jgi:glycosyltransferase involved in cell wall biosynthesis